MPFYHLVDSDYYDPSSKLRISDIMYHQYSDLDIVAFKLRDDWHYIKYAFRAHNVGPKISEEIFAKWGVRWSLLNFCLDGSQQTVRQLTSCVVYFYVCILWVLKFLFKAHSLTMLLRQNLLHNIALEYCGNKKGNDFVTMGKRFWIQIFKNALWCLLWFVIVVALA